MARVGPVLDELKRWRAAPVASAMPARPPFLWEVAVYAALGIGIGSMRTGTGLPLWAEGAVGACVVVGYASLAWLPLDRMLVFVLDRLRRRRRSRAPLATAGEWKPYHSVMRPRITGVPGVAEHADAGPFPKETGFVESGAFRVDLSSAVEKLARYQAADPGRFLLSWLRCAAASGAGSVAVSSDVRGLVLRFDGQALPPGLLEDPIGALVGGVEDHRSQGRHLGAGLLAAMRLGATRLVAVSGEGAERRQVQWTPEPTEAAAALDEGQGSTLRVDWPAKRAAELNRTCLDALEEEFGLAPLRLSIDGRPVPSWPSQGGWFRFERVDVRGVVGWGGERAERSRVRVYHLGAFVEELPWDFAGGGGPALVHVEDPRLALDLSHSNVVADGRLQDTLREVGAAMAAAGDVRERRLRSARRERKLTVPRPRLWIDLALFLAWAVAAGAWAWAQGRYVAGTSGAEVVTIKHYFPVVCVPPHPQLWAIVFIGTAFHLRASRRCPRFFGRLYLPALALAMFFLVAVVVNLGRPNLVCSAAVGPAEAVLRSEWPHVDRIPKREFQGMHLTHWDGGHPPAVWDLVFLTERGERFISLEGGGTSLEAARSISRLLGVPLEFRRVASDTSQGRSYSSSFQSLEPNSAPVARPP